MAAARIPQHRHCQVCGRAVKLSQEMCSDKCKQDWEGTIRQKKRWLWGFYIALGVMVVVFMISLLRGG